MRPIVKRRGQAIKILRQQLVPLDELLEPRFMQGADGLAGP